MFNTLLFIHLVISILLISVILLQKTSSDGVSGLSGGGNNMGLVAGRTTANFLTRITSILIFCFFANAILMANLSSKTGTNILDKIDKETDKKVEKKVKEESLPMAQ